MRSSLFYLGEYVDFDRLVAINIENKERVVDALAQSGLDIHVSIDPTQVGYQIDADRAIKSIRAIAARIHRHQQGDGRINCLMLDMEDCSVVDATIAMHDTLQRDGLPVALTLQAYLRRTADDLARQVTQGSRVRLVKGAFAAGPRIAFRRRAEIKANSRRLIETMLSPEAKANGFYPIIATHDTALHEFATEVARRGGWRQGSYEFEMLLGVRSDVAFDLAKRGERVRLYLPFGEDWWPYAVRRIGENPANAVLLARALFS